MDAIHLSVAFRELCETAMKFSRGYLFARRRASRKVFSAKGHPQCLKNTTTAGLPSATGNRSFADECAFDPITGAAQSSIGGGGGVAQECHDLGTERLANGFANGAGASRFLGASGKERALEGMPALRRV